MNKRKIKLLLLVFGIIIIILIVLACLKIYNQRLIYESDVFVATKEDHLKSFFSNDNFCIINREEMPPLVIPDKYVIDYYMTLNEKYVVKGGYGDDNTLQELKAEVQDISTLKVIKEIDIKELLAPYMQEYQVKIVGMYLRKVDGIYYLVKEVSKRYSEAEMRKRDVWNYRERKEIWIDVETEEVQLKEVAEKNRGYCDNIWMLAGTRIVSKSISENVRVRNSDYLDDTSFISIPTAGLPENNKKLYEMFPELKNASKEEGIFAHIFLTPQTNDLEALSLIMEDNQELDFSVLEPDEDGYYGYYPINGENHYITKEEYEQFQKEYWEYQKKQREE